MPPPPTPTPASGTGPSHEDWRRDRDAHLPPPALPPRRRSFGERSGMACPARLYRGGGGLYATVEDMELVAGGLVAAAPAADRRPGTLPSGYTYLAQLLLHDMCAATEGKFNYLKIEKALRPAERRPGLMLDSIFGEDGQGISARGVYRFPASSVDPGRPVGVDLDRRFDPRATPPRDVAVVADPRNDDTPMVAQLAALFVLLFQTLCRRLDAQGAAAGDLARALTAETFHRIVREDLLRRLLHPDVAALYLSGTPHYADPGAETAGAEIPIEFTNAVFRFGHSLVRPTYLMNDRSPPASPLTDLMKGFKGIERRRAHNANFWRVDWRLFFGDGPQVQMARRLGPSLSSGLVERSELRTDHQIGPELGAWKHDLALMDMARSADGGLQSVAALVERLHPRFRREPLAAAWAFRDAGTRCALLRDWAAAVPAGVGGRPLPAHVEDDPPVALFVLIEAGHDGAREEGYGRGETLGAFGSVLAAEVILPEMRRAQALIARPGLDAARDAAFGAAQPATMPELVSHLT